MPENIFSVIQEFSSPRGKFQVLARRVHLEPAMAVAQAAALACEDQDGYVMSVTVLDGSECPVWIHEYRRGVIYPTPKMRTELRE